MSNELEKRFTTYLNKTLRGYSNRQKIKYQEKTNIEDNLTDLDVNKISYKNYLLNTNEIDNIDVDINHLENIFHNEKYCKAMKKVPLKQRQVLYLLFVEEYTTKEVAKYFHTTTDNINKIKQNAIKNFKKNLEELNG